MQSCVCKFDGKLVARVNRVAAMADSMVSEIVD